jgi:molecular chaperone GrpE
MPDATPGPDNAPEAPAAAEPDPFAVLQGLQKENADMKDRLLRTLAEMENLRRRTEREVADARVYGVTNFARDLLGLADNLGRAIENIPQEARDAADGPLKALIEGVELSSRDFLSALARHGVKKVEPKGEKFDPNLHQAMFEAPNPALPAGTVTEVVQSGWTIGDRVLRPALVGVSKGGPKAAPKVETAA